MFILLVQKRLSLRAMMLLITSRRRCVEHFHHTGIKLPTFASSMTFIDRCSRHRQAMECRWQSNRYMACRDVSHKKLHDGLCLSNLLSDERRDMRVSAAARRCVTIAGHFILTRRQRFPLLDRHRPERELNCEQLVTFSIDRFFPSSERLSSARARVVFTNFLCTCS